MIAQPVPLFYLYGEPHRHVDADFIHVESLDDRTRPSEWTIRPHSHAELHQMFLVLEGGGTLHVDGRDLPYAAPAILVVPSTFVHGFSWSRDARGWVATVAREELQALAYGDPEVAPIFRTARAIALPPADARIAEQSMIRLARELGWAAPGQRVALRAALLDLLVIVLRQSLTDATSAQPPGQQAALVARFREDVDGRFRLREPISAYADRLGVSLSGLRAACARIAGQSPSAILDQRSLLEAQRSLLYTNLPVAEVGYSLGFADPGYFSRFFTRHAGCSPRDYRVRRGIAV